MRLGVGDKLHDEFALFVGDGEMSTPLGIDHNGFVEVLDAWKLCFFSFPP